MPTLDVATQESGPRLPLAQLAARLSKPPSGHRGGHPLLNVVSLSLAGTALEGEVLPPEVGIPAPAIPPHPFHP